MDEAMLSDKERLMIESVGWPTEILEDPRRQPRMVRSPEAFANEVLLGDHLDDIVIFPGGLGKIGLGEADVLPHWLISALDSPAARTSVLGFLRGLGPEELAAHKAALEFPDERGVQREALPRPYPFCLWEGPSSEVSAVGPGAAGALPEAWRDLRQRLAAAESLLARGELDESRLYACEMRRLREREANPGAAASLHGEELKTKSLSLRHVRDWLGELSCWSLYWNCYDDGIFVGGRGSGKGLHVDQVLWSNVGKQWRGHKLLVVWPSGSESARLVAEMGDAHFRPPLGQQQLAALRCASKVALLRPGDLFLCSGGVAHATISASEELTVTGYESLVTLHPRHVAQLLQTGATCGPSALDRGVMEPEELRELRGSVALRLQALLREVAPSRKPESAADGGLRSAVSETQLRSQLAEAARLVAFDPSYAVQIGGAGVCRLLAAADYILPRSRVEVKRPHNVLQVQLECSQADGQRDAKRACPQIKSETSSQLAAAGSGGHGSQQTGPDTTGSSGGSSTGRSMALFSLGWLVG
ncbi:unnamed protein product [Polarella glacialis]|uniref:Uncharacterized protein n=2 Tax=Polarella glacialis TaxID=89957 RepID=A0A813FS21_POLGL|nr:unnamed protein product [Polarella glacialis]